MAGELPFPYNAWSLMSKGAQSRVDNVNPMLREQGLASVLAENLQRQGGAQNQMLAGQMQANPGAGLGAQQQLNRNLAVESGADRDFGAGAFAQAQADQSNVLTDMMRGTAPGQGQRGQPASSYDMQRVFDILDQDSAKLRATEDRRGLSMPRSDLVAERTRRETELEPFIDVEMHLKAVPQLDPHVAQDVLQMINYWQKNVDPGGVVRGEDVRLLNKAGASTWGVFLNDLEGAVVAGGVPGEMGVQIQKSLMKMLENRDDQRAQIGDDQDARSDFREWTKSDRRIGTANPQGMKRARGRRLKREKKLWVDSPDGLKRKRMSDGKFYSRGELTSMPELQGLTAWEG